MKDKNLDNHDNWATPKKFYKKLDEEFNFNFDPCPLNPLFDGLTINWGTRNFVNPPYSRKLKDAFIKKAISESNKGRLSVCLIPVSTSTLLFHHWIFPNASEIRFIEGRLKFVGINTKGMLVNNKTGMHDSMLVIFDKSKKYSNKGSLIITKMVR